MISTKTVGNKIKKCLQSAGYTVIVTLKGEETNNPYLSIMFEDVEYIYSLKSYVKVTDAVNQIVNAFVASISNKDVTEIDSRDDKEILLSSVYPVLVKAKKNGCVCGTWDNFYVIFKGLYCNEEVTITPFHLKTLDISEADISNRALENVMKNVDIYDTYSLLKATFNTELADLFSKVKLLTFFNSVNFLVIKQPKMASGVLLLNNAIGAIADSLKSDLILIPADDKVFIIETYEHLKQYSKDTDNFELVDIVYEIIDNINEFQNTKFDDILTNAFIYERESHSLSLL